MNIFDASLLLNVPESYIKDYIRNKLVPNHKINEKALDLNETDILRLKEIIILRKIGLGIVDIIYYYKGKKQLLKLAADMLKYEEDDSEKAKIYKMIVDDNQEKIDVDKYWDLTFENEELNKNYVEHMADLKSVKNFAQSMMLKLIKYKTEDGISLFKCFMIFFGITLAAALIRIFVFHSTENIIFSALYPLILIAANFIFAPILFILYRLLGAQIMHTLTTIFFLLVGLLFITLFILLLISGFNSVSEWIHP